MHGASHLHCLHSVFSNYLHLQTIFVHMVLVWEDSSHCYCIQTVFTLMETGPTSMAFKNTIHERSSESLHLRPFVFQWTVMYSSKNYLIQQTSKHPGEINPNRPVCESFHSSRLYFVFLLSFIQAFVSQSKTTTFSCLLLLQQILPEKSWSTSCAILILLNIITEPFP